MHKKPLSETCFVVASALLIFAFFLQGAAMGWVCQYCSFAGGTLPGGMVASPCTGVVGGKDTINGNPVQCNLNAVAIGTCVVPGLVCIQGYACHGSYGGSHQPCDEVAGPTGCQSLF